MAVCPAEVHRLSGDTHTVNRDACVRCGACVTTCPQDALKLVGKEMTAQEVFAEVIKDKKYYDTSGGGMTVSGGESTVQYDFLCALLTLARENGIHTCIETNGIVPSERLEALCKLVDLFLFDYKATDEEIHRAYTGCERSRVLDSLALLAEKGAACILRCPIIPGINDNDAHFAAIRALRGRYSNILDAEIMPYHDIGKNKWDEVGLTYTLPDLKSVPPEQAKIWRGKIVVHSNGDV